MWKELTDGVTKNCVMSCAPNFAYIHVITVLINKFPMFVNSLKKGPIVKMKMSQRNKEVGQASENKGWPKLYQIIFEGGEAR